ncbi:MAG: hypothetical protein ACE5EL_08755, partial [Anaerolineae bacterium]
MRRIPSRAATGPLPWRALVATTLAAGILAAVAAGPHIVFKGRIMPGVTAGGVDLGGKGPSDAEAALAALGRRATTTAVTLTDPHRDLVLT